MLTLILGKFGSGKSTDIKKRVRALTEQGVDSFLVVPEQATVASERAFAEYLPPSAPLHFEVTNFSRLANTVFRRAGGLSCRQLGSDGRLFLMWRALHECRGLFSTPIDENKVENVHHFLSAADEFRMSGIDTELLTNALPSLSSHKNLQAKINDYLLVTAAYRALAEEKEAYPTGSELSRLARLLEESPYLNSAPLFFDGFVSLTAEELQVVRALLGANDLTFAIDCPTFAPPPLAYAEAYDTVCRLKALAEEKNIPVRIEKRTEVFRPQDPVFHYIADSLFSSQECAPYQTSDEPEASLCPPIRIKESDSVFDEANDIAAEICRLVQEEGARYRDILVVGRGVEAYRGILDEVLARNGIPFYFSEKTDIEAYEPIKLIFAAYSMRAANFRTTDVIAYLKCGFSGIAREDCDAMEIYVTAWKLQGARFTDPRPWTFPPRGYTADTLTDHEHALLDRLNLAKASILDAFSLFGGAPRERSVKEHATALVLFLERLGVAEKLEACAKRETARGKLTAAENFRMLYPCICRTLDRTVELLSDTVISEKDFTALLSLAFSTVSIGSIPSAFDEVVIGDARMLRPSAPKHTILFGVNEGVFPGIAEEQGFFSRAERRLLRSEAKVELQEDAYFASARERYDFLRAFLSPSQTLFITYPRMSGALAPLQPSSALESIRALGASRVGYRGASEQSVTDLLYRRESILDLLSRVDSPEDRTLLLTLAKEDDELAERTSILDLPIVMPECRVSPRIPDGTPLALSQSRLDSFASCPFAYTCKYVLRLREDNEADFRYAESGTFVHALLENFFKYLREHHLSIDELSEEKRLEVLASIAADYESNLFSDDRIASRRLSHTCQRLSASAVPVLDALKNEFADSDFTPVFFELPIGGKGITPPPLLLADGTPITMEGKIDRVDFCRVESVREGSNEKECLPYLRVIDYKTGTKTFDVKNIDRGIDLQMLLYLHTLVETKDERFRRALGLSPQEKLLPAGMFYLMATQKSLPLAAPCTEDELRRASADAVTRSGLLLNESDVIKAMARENAADLFGLSVNRRGVLSAKSGITLATHDELDSYFSVMKNRILSIGQSIVDGVSHALPLIRNASGASSCQYCAYKSVCRNAKNPKSFDTKESTDA